MNASQPEAEYEYSRGRGAPRGRSPDPETRPERRFETHRSAVLAGVWLGAALLAIAEFLPLLHVQSSGRAQLVGSVTTGSHHAYALLPVAVLAAALAFSTRRSGSRLALLAFGVLGLLAIGIALLGDLPSAHSTGLMGTPATGLATASSSPAAGLFVETAGGALLLLAAAAGMLLEPVPELKPRAPRAAGASPTRSAS